MLKNPGPPALPGSPLHQRHDTAERFDKHGLNVQRYPHRWTLSHEQMYNRIFIASQ